MLAPQLAGFAASLGVPAYASPAPRARGLAARTPGVQMYRVLFVIQIFPISSKSTQLECPVAKF
jgi:hypothetical protein